MVLEHGIDWLNATGSLGHMTKLRSLGDCWLGHDELLHVGEEGLLWGLLVSIVVIDSDVVSHSWLSPDWVLGEDGSELLWLR